jgi:transcriptional regulator with XRE-family HTH domain
MGDGATKSTETADQIAHAKEDDAAIGAGGLPRLALRHSPEAIRWVRRQRGWRQSDLARASGLSVSTISGLENGSRNVGPLVLAKLAEVLECPQVVLEAGQINAVATSALSALDLLARLLQISDPTHLTRRHGCVWLGFIASGRHIGTLHMREKDFDELVNALRRHFPNRHDGNNTRGTTRPNATTNW